MFTILKHHFGLSGIIILFLLMFGFCLNTCVKIINNGKMPLATSAEHVLFAIGARDERTYQYPDIKQPDEKLAYQPIDRSTRLAFLGDCIIYSLEYPMFENIHPLIQNVFMKMGVPLGRSALASPGDLILFLMIWAWISIHIPKISKIAICLLFTTPRM